MDDIDRQLLILFQKEIPLKPRPFDWIGKAAGIHSADVMLRLNRLQEEGLLGPVSAVWNAGKIGCRSYWFAMQVPDRYVQQAAYHLSGHPGVTYCVRRRGAFNFWFSLTLPRQETLEFHAGRLKELSKTEHLIPLKTEKIYKTFGRTEEWLEEVKKEDAEDLTPLEQKLVSLLQEAFPLADDPYGWIAREIGSSRELVLKQLQYFYKSGRLRKICALPPMKNKKAQNALLLWQLPEEKSDRAGAALAEFPEIIFCVKRAPSEELPYTLHVLAETDGEDEIEPLIRRMETEIGMWPRRLLMKEKEEKRARIKYFSRDIEDWRLQHEGQPAPLSI